MIFAFLGQNGVESLDWADANALTAYDMGRGRADSATVAVQHSTGPAGLDGSFAPAFEALIIRTCDMIIALAAIVLVAPLTVLIAAFIFLSDGGPVFYSHHRIGEGGKRFPCHKFRSMSVDSAARLQRLLESDERARWEWATYHKLTNDPRITALGRFLRKSSLDELPQLWNVVRGDMSIVGPRPIVAEEMCRYGRYVDHYLQCRPGLTGLWQISGRSNTTYRRRIALDVTWSRSRSLSFYWWILLRTLPSVLAARGSA